MRKYKSKYLKPYIRKAKPRDYKPENSSNFRTCIRQALYQTLKEEYGKDAYVLVQHGSSKVVEIGSSKEQLQNQNVAVYFSRKRKTNRKHKSFNRWRNSVKHIAQK